jgi:glyoxalase family protein
VLLGLHHVTAFAGDAQRTLDFYTGFMGMRLVKRTVNFDDPSTYHFYFGDARATPGSLLTFFPWPTAPVARLGSGQITGASFAVSKEALAGWTDRARHAGIECSEPAARFGETWIALTDPAGLSVELFGVDGGGMRLHSATLRESDVARTAAFLTGILGFSQVATEGDRTRFRSNHTVIDIVAAPGLERGRLSAGMVHHVAFRVAEESAQLEWREKLKQAGVHVTRVIDRLYFRSIYFREPGGALFEIATDGPGFFVDEAELGSGLRLPPWLESVRESIERRLPAVSSNRGG